MKKITIFLSVVTLLTACVPGIPVESLFCLTGNANGTAKIETVGGNIPLELFSVTADGKSTKNTSNEIAFSSACSYYKVRYIDDGPQRGVEYPTGYRIILPNNESAVEIAVLDGREVRDFPANQRVEINEMSKVFMNLDGEGKTEEAWKRLKAASEYDKDRRYTQLDSATRTWEMTFQEIVTYKNRLNENVEKYGIRWNYANQIK